MGEGHMAECMAQADISVFITQVSTHQKDNAEVPQFSNQVDKFTKEN